MWVFAVAALILLAMFFSRAARFKVATESITTQFRKAWIALTENRTV
jgi:hypothetical protein